MEMYEYKVWSHLKEHIVRTHMEMYAMSLVEVSVSSCLQLFCYLFVLFQILFTCSQCSCCDHNIHQLLCLRMHIKIYHKCQLFHCLLCSITLLYKPLLYMHMIRFHAGFGVCYSETCVWYRCFPPPIHKKKSRRKNVCILTFFI